MTTANTPAAPADDFDAVFDAITKLDEHGKELENPPAPAAEAAKEPAKEPAAEPVAAVVEEPAAEPAKEPAAEVVAEPAAAVEPTAEEKAAARIAELEAELATKAAAPAPADPVDAPQPASAAAEAAAPPAIKWYEPPAEEATAIAAYEKEWPEISAAEKLRTKAAVFNAVQYVFAEVAKAYGPTMDRFKATADAIEEHMTLQELRGAHNDYDTIRDKVEDWAGKLPAAFRAGAKEVLKSGTPDEVNSLIAEYKKQNPAAAAPAAPAAKTELSPAAKKAAGKLTVVDSKRTTQASAADPNDFDAAWDEPEAAKG